MSHTADQEEKLKLIIDLVTSIKEFQDAVDLFDSRAALALDVHGTDLRCLATLNDRGPLTAGEISAVLELTKGATTAAIQRLKRKKLISVRRNEDDGRSIFIELTVKAREKMIAIWMPMRKEGFKHLNGYTKKDLILLTEFFMRARRLQQNCAFGANQIVGPK